MEAEFWKKNVAFIWEFYVQDAFGTPVTGLTGGSFTKLLYKDEVTNAQTVTIAETDSTNLKGWYTASFVPNATGRWFNLITSATYNVDGWYATANVRNQDIDSLVGALMLEPVANWESDGAFNKHSLVMALAFLTNKAAIVSNTLTIYKTDGTTVLETYTLVKDPAANPIVTSTPA